MQLLESVQVQHLLIPMEGGWDNGIGIDALNIHIPLLRKRSLNVTANTMHKAGEIPMDMVIQDVRHAASVSTL